MRGSNHRESKRKSFPISFHKHYGTGYRTFCLPLQFFLLFHSQHFSWQLFLMMSHKPAHFYWLNFVFKILVDLKYLEISFLCRKETVIAIIIMTIRWISILPIIILSIVLMRAILNKRCSKNEAKKWKCNNLFPE